MDVLQVMMRMWQGSIVSGTGASVSVGIGAYSVLKNGAIIGPVHESCSIGQTSRIPVQITHRGLCLNGNGNRRNLSVGVPMRVGVAKSRPKEPTWATPTGARGR